MPSTLNSTMRWTGVSDYITVNGTSAQSSAFASHTHEIRVVSTTNCHINIAQDPTAAATDSNGFYLPAGVVEYFHVSPGQKVAVIQDTGAGVLCVAQMSR